MRCVKVKGCMIHIQDVDILDGTPLLDIKPYVPDFDSRMTERIGWLSGKSSNVYKKEVRWQVGIEFHLGILLL